MINERFKTEFTKADELFFDSIKEDALNDEKVRDAAHANSYDNFGFVFNKKIEDLFVDRMEQNEKLTAKFLNDKDFKQVVSAYLMKEEYMIRSGVRCFNLNKFEVFMNEPVNIYCDESCHLLHDQQQAMVIGAVKSLKKDSMNHNHQIALLKEKHNLSPFYEANGQKYLMVRLIFIKN